MPAPFNSNRVDPFAQLDQEWAHIASRRHHTSKIRRWAAQDPALADVEHLGDFVTQDRARRSRYFGPVLHLVIAGDELASRVLVQMLIPGLVRIAGELAGLFTNPRPQLEDLSSDVVATAWHQIKALAEGRSSARTPRGVLLNIRRDTIRWHQTLGNNTPSIDAHATWTPAPDRPRRPRRAVFIASAPSTANDEIETRLTLDQAVAAGVIDQAAADLIWRVAVEDRPVNEAAAEIGLGKSWAHEKRHAALARLGTHLAVA